MSEVEVDPPETSPEPVKGLDAILSSALETYGDEPKSDDAPPVEPKSDKPRDESGRFAKADAKPSETEPAKADATPPTKVAEPPQAEPIQPPSRWSEADKATFASWPREVQEKFLDRHNAIEGDYTRKTQEIAEQRKQNEALFATVGRWSPYFQQIGMTPEAALNSLAQAEYTLRNGTPAEKQAVFARLAQDYGLYPNQTAPQGQPATYPQPDPVVSQLAREWSDFKQQQELSENQRVQSEIETFRQSKAEDGSPKYPHFDRVREIMGKLIDGGQADDLPTAYSKAVRLDDELFTQTVEAERKRVAADAERARQEAVEKAKKASPVRSSDGAPKGATQLKGLDAHLNAALERMGG